MIGLTLYLWLITVGPGVTVGAGVVVGAGSSGEALEPLTLDASICQALDAAAGLDGASEGFRDYGAGRATDGRTASCWTLPMPARD